MRQTNYVYDLAGNRVELSVVDQDATQNRTVTYTLDANDRLLTETNDQTASVNDTHTVYTYDVTEQSSKTVHDGLDDTGTIKSSTTYSYNLQGRLSQVQIDSDGDTVADTETDYIYNANGTRVQQTITEDGGAPVVHDYLVDENNLTGYAQVLEEYIDAALAVAYTIGLDVIAQAKENGTTDDVHFFLHDAHGSTRALLDELAAVIETYAFDAYGNALDFNPATALTTLLYSGEQFDAKIAMQYLRARYYDASVGRFNRLDPFFGNLDDPQSLNKYLYTHGNPIAGIDPTGMFQWGGNAELLTSSAIEAELQAIRLPTVASAAVATRSAALGIKALAALAATNIVTLSLLLKTLPRGKSRTDICQEILGLAPGISTGRWWTQRPSIGGNITVQAAAFRLDRWRMPPVGQRASVAAGRWVRRVVGKPTDHAGHVIGRKLAGGSTIFNAIPNGNIFPQNTTVNIGAMKGLEVRLANLHRKGNDVCAQVTLVYDSPQALRPSSILYFSLIRRPGGVFLPLGLGINYFPNP